MSDTFATLGDDDTTLTPRQIAVVKVVTTVVGSLSALGATFIVVTFLMLRRREERRSGALLRNLGAAFRSPASGYGVASFASPAFGSDSAGGTSAAPSPLLGGRGHARGATAGSARLSTPSARVSTERLLELYSGMLLWLSAADLVGALAYAGLSEANGDPRVCVAQSLLIEFSDLASMLWTCAMAYELYKIVVPKYGILRDPALRHTAYFWGCWLLPLLCVCVPLGFRATDGPHGLFGLTGGWCWLRGWPLRISYYGALVLAVLFCLSMYVVVLLRTRRQLRRARRPHARAALCRISAYPAIFVLTNSFAIVSRATEFVDGRQTYALLLLQAFFSPLQGLANALVYGSSNRVVKEIWLRRDGDGRGGHCCRSGGYVCGGYGDDDPDGVLGGAAHGERRTLLSGGGCGRAARLPARGGSGEPGELASTLSPQGGGLPGAGGRDGPQSYQSSLNSLSTSGSNVLEGGSLNSFRDRLRSEDSAFGSFPVEGIGGSSGGTGPDPQCSFGAPLEHGAASTVLR